MTMSKSEEKILEMLEESPSGRVSIQGKRLISAALKMQRDGKVKTQSVGGYIYRNTRMGCKREYAGQLIIEGAAATNE